jgi:aflatoxin B1 aldehyde reductase
MYHPIGREGIRVTSVEDTNALLDTFQKHGHSEVDSARSYGGGSTEKRLAEANWQKRGIVMDTKLYPTKGKGMGWLTTEEWSLEPKDARAGLMASLKALQADKIDMFYLHGPDRNTPFEDTLSEVDKLHREGYFARFGISNFQSWEVAKICEICEKNGWIKPTVFQGLYNAFQRSVEAELIPCLRHYGISLYAFQPLAGGFLTSKYQRNQEEYEPGSRFDPSRLQGKLHQGRYMNDRYFDALEILRPVAKKHSLTEAECGLRWMVHHSVLKKELKDALIVGASSTKQLEENLVDLEKGPLPDEVVQALNDGWTHVSGTYKYWH